MSTVSDIEAHLCDASNEDDIALKFAVMYANKLKFDHTRGSWYAWDGDRWKVEGTNLAFDWARNLCRAMRVNNKQEKLASIRVATAVEKFSQADRRFAVTHEIWNPDPWLLCTPCGTVDLKNGELSANNPDNLITMCTGVSPAAMQTPVWNRFLKDATNNDSDLERFLQIVAGYCLTGVTYEHALFFLYGFGGNGKSTFVNVLADLMTDYAVTASMDTFVASRSDRHPTELARLEGARLVAASETEEGRAWAESRIKQLTGGDPVAARYMRQDFFEFKPQFKLLIQGNHQPTLNNVDDAMRRRFNIIPFIFKPPKPNPGLADQLKAEYPGILQWAIHGCLAWREQSLVKPEAVQVETDQYFSEQDIFSQWVSECTERCGVTMLEPNHVLWKSWEAFASRIGEKPGNQRALGDNLARSGYRRGRTKSEGRGFKGIKVKIADDGYAPYTD